MLVKLLKNDFIQTGRMFVWLLAGGLAAGGLGALITMTQEIGAGQFILALLWNFLLIIGAAILEAVGLVIILVSINRSLFSERGYLTFALPVSTMEMLFSKFVTNVVFMLLNIAEAAALIYVAFSNFRRLFSNAGTALMNQFGVTADMQAELDTTGLLGLPSFGELLKFGLFLLIVLLVFLILAMMIALFVLTVSHVRPFQAKPGLWIPIFFLGASIVCQQVVHWISKYAKITVPLRFGGVMAEEAVKLNMTTAIVMVGLSVALFFLTNWFLSRKISLK